MEQPVTTVTRARRTTCVRPGPVGAASVGERAILRSWTFELLPVGIVGLKLRTASAVPAVVGELGDPANDGGAALVPPGPSPFECTSLNHLVIDSNRI